MMSVTTTFLASPDPNAGHSGPLAFPPGFMWGAATAALQIEGGTTADGRGPSMWDVFCRQHPERIFDGSTPDVACDHYRRFREDVRLVRELGHNAYRFSIAWPRLFPDGTGRLNPAGVAFYHELLDELAAAGITPHVTLYHWDLPQSLADRGGWENPATIDAFVAYADTCFHLYGDRIGWWATLNEPGWSTLNGYVTGLHPPCRRDLPAAIQVATHLVLANARAIEVFRRGGAPGRIGLVLNLSPIDAATDAPADVAAARLADGLLDRWFAEPAVTGQFPADIWNEFARRNVLPNLSVTDSTCIARHPVDFLGVNYYYPRHAAATTDARDDFHLNVSGRRDEDCRFVLGDWFELVKNPRGRFTAWGWEIEPDGLRRVLLRAHQLRPGLDLFVTENGLGRQEELVDGTVDDRERIDFVSGHLAAVHQAIVAGANVRGYFMWSLLDNWSWLNGYRKRYGFIFVDRETLARHPKASARWFAEVAQTNQLARG